MRISKNPTISSMLHMTQKLNEVTHGAVSIDIEVWTYDSKEQRIRYSIWFGHNKTIRSAKDWIELVLIFKEEVTYATQHSRPIVSE